MAAPAPPAPRGRRGVRRLLSILGPGLVAGAADDDPSGVATYSIAGAQFGTALLWTAAVTWPLMAVVQMTCARIGMVTGGGLASALRQKLPRPVMGAIALALLAANTLNVGADLSGMADAAEELTGVTSHVFVVLFAVGLTLAVVRLRYSQIASALKWLALALGAYVVTAVSLSPDWHAILRDAFVPSLPRGRQAWEAVVGILGTTISPYLFFWQASQEVEEEKAKGRVVLAQRLGASHREIADRRLDVGVGTFYSNLIMFFIILTAALTLHRAGLTHVETARDAARALAPLAGRWAAAVYSAGIIGVGLLAVPTLSASAAYALAETFAWPEGLDLRLSQARRFYLVVAASTLLGIVFDFIGVSSVRLLYLSAILNGILAPFLLLAMLAVARDARLMQGQRSPGHVQALLGLTALGMLAAAVAMAVT